jgi:hypothetical protein
MPNLGTARPLVTSAFAAALALTLFSSRTARACAADDECKEHRACVAGVCSERQSHATASAVPACTADADCAGAQVCEMGVCAAPPPPAVSAPVAVPATALGPASVAAPATDGGARFSADGAPATEAPAPATPPGVVFLIVAPGTEGTHRDAPTPPAKSSAEEPRPRGANFFFDMTASAHSMGGQLAGGVGVGDFNAVTGLRLGMYFGAGLSLSVAAEVGYGAQVTNCASACSKSYMFRFPTMLQWHLRGVYEGPFLAGGVNFAAANGWAPSDGSDGGTGTLFSPYEYAAALGWTFGPSASGAQFELRAEAAAGKLSSAEVNGYAYAVGGGQPDYFTGSLSVVAHFWL